MSTGPSSTSVTDQPRGHTGRRRAPRLGSADVIRDAAGALFLRKGYVGTSMDEVASLAGVSKQTVYTHFTDKEQLFTDLVLGNTKRVDSFLDETRALLHDARDPARELHALARRYVTFVIRPEVLQLRRLVISESTRFPELARRYYENVPERMVAALATCLQCYASKGLLRFENPRQAAEHFVWLVLGQPLDRALFLGVATPSARALEQHADAAVDAFLAAYRTALNRASYRR